MKALKLIPALVVGALLPCLVTAQPTVVDNRGRSPMCDGQGRSCSLGVNEYGEIKIGAGSQTIGAVVINGNTITACAARAVSASAYAAGDVIATDGQSGLITLANVFRSGVLSGTIVSVRVTDAAAQGVGYTFLPFNAALTGGTISGNSPATIADADLTKVAPPISVTAVQAFGDNSVSHWTGAVPIVSADTSLRGLLLTTGAPTYVATTDVNVCVTVYQD